MRQTHRGRRLLVITILALMALAILPGVTVLYANSHCGDRNSQQESQNGGMDWKSVFASVDGSERQPKPSELLQPEISSPPIYRLFDNTKLIFIQVSIHAKNSLSLVCNQLTYHSRGVYDSDGSWPIAARASLFPSTQNTLLERLRVSAIPDVNNAPGTPSTRMLKYGILTVFSDDVYTLGSFLQVVVHLSPSGPICFFIGSGQIPVKDCHV